MNEPNDGGPAFPAAFSSHQPGMMLRDYFAAKAMQGMVADGALQDDPCQHRVTGLAVFSYEVADAMLKARAK